jgi:hypothetical protein
MPEIQRVSHTHNAIMDYMLANPGVSLGEVAAHFKYSQPWLSCIIHSDAFQSLMREKQGVIFHTTVLPIREKLHAVGHQVLDRLAERIPLENDVAVLARTSEGVLDRLGFGSKTGGNTYILNQTNNTQVNTLRSELDNARALLGKVEKPVIGVVIDESGKPSLPIPSQTYLGKDDSRASTPLSTNGTERTTATEGVET